MAKSKVYTVRACRWGGKETHSYIVGVFTKKHKAQKIAELEEQYRGGKYECEIIEWTIDKDVWNKDFPTKTIKALPKLDKLERMNRGMNSRIKPKRSYRIK